MRQIDFDNKIFRDAWQVVAVVCLLMASHALSQSGGDYELNWSTIDGGGGQSSGDDYVLIATTGQPEAGASSGGDYELLGGFLPGGPLCFVDFERFARLAEHWLQEACNEVNNWCDGADLNQHDGVNGVDLRLFIEQWLCYCPDGWELK